MACQQRYCSVTGDVMDEMLKLSLLFDFYGSMLTAKQQLIMELFHEEDYSLAEIAEKLDISRQAVYDAFKKAKSSLLHYEQKLRLMEKFVENGKVANAIDGLINEVVADIEFSNISRVTGDALVAKLGTVRDLTEKIRYNQ